MLTSPEHKANQVSELIEVGKKSNLDTNLISDGYHTFGELYEHRITLFITLCRTLRQVGMLLDSEAAIKVWRSKLHHDETAYDGWFIMGINLDKGNQISYHLPESKWQETNFCVTLTKAPEWDGHTSADVLERLKSL